MTNPVITEGKARIAVATASTVSKKMPVFYNPAMTLNRDITVLLLTALGRKSMRMADVLAGSGIRTIRLLKELPPSMVEEVTVNDGRADFKTVFAKNARLSKASTRKVVLHNQDTNILLHESGGLDYIDIDPFGSPAPFLDAAVRHLARDGILALTATDTAALAGTAPDACRRKYWALPLRNHLMHEVGMRILARKAQLVAAQYDRALVPIYCHATLHYDRIFLRATKSKEQVSGVLDMHRYLVYNEKTDEFGIRDHNKKAPHEHVAGPLWSGPLWDAGLATRIAALARPGETARLAQTIKDEAAIPVIGFHDIHGLAGKAHINAPSFDALIKRLNKQGYDAARTHFSPSGLRTDADAATVKKLLR